MGYFSDNSVRPDRQDLLNSYVASKDGFDDDLMRKAVSNLNNMTHPYDLLGFDTCTGKYNCQDWANDVRQEYYKLKNKNDLQFWNNLINNR